MKKRKELDALVSGGKSGKRCNGKKIGTGGSYSAHELLSSSRLESDSSDLDDFASVLQPRRSRKKVGSHVRIAAICLPLCQFVLVTTCILVSATLIWLHIGMREDLDILRAHLQKVEAGNRNTPEAFHVIHSKLKQLDFNVSTLFLEISKNLADIVNCTTEIKYLKDTSNKLQASIAAAPEIQDLPKNLNSLSESVAGFGSKINALESTVKELKEFQGSLQSSTQSLSGEVSSIKSMVKDLSNSTKINSSEVKASNSPYVRDLTIQSAIQETNQQVSYLQKELIDLVRSIDKMNSSLSALNDLYSKVDTLNNAFVWNVNDTHHQNDRIFVLENYVNTNLTLRVEHMENEESRAVEKFHSNSEISTIQELVNKTITAAVLKITNPDTNPVDLYKHSQNISQQFFSHAHDVLLLLANLLKEINRVPNGAVLSKESATEIIGNLIKNTLTNDMTKFNIKIQELEKRINELSTQQPTSRGHSDTTSLNKPLSQATTVTSGITTSQTPMPLSESIPKL